MPRLRKQVIVSNAGFGKPGYCKLCAATFEDELNARVRQGWSAGQLIRWASKFKKPDGTPYSVSENTMYKHMQHAKNPTDRFVSMVERTRAKAARTRPKATADDLLEAVIERGAQIVEDDPESVTLKDALKAAQIKFAKPEKVTNLSLIYAQVVTGLAGDRPALPEPAVEGEVREIDAGTDDSA